jgi:hypothetical protein
MAARAPSYKVLDLDDDEVATLTKLGAEIGTKKGGNYNCKYHSGVTGKGPAVVGPCTGNYFARELYGENEEQRKNAGPNAVFAKNHTCVERTCGPRWCWTGAPKTAIDAKKCIYGPVQEDHENIVSEFKKQIQHRDLINKAEEVIQKYKNLVEPHRSQSTRDTASLAARFLAEPQTPEVRESMAPEVIDAYLTLLSSDRDFSSAVGREWDPDKLKNMIQEKFGLSNQWANDLVQIFRGTIETESPNTMAFQISPQTAAMPVADQEMRIRMRELEAENARLRAQVQETFFQLTD